MKIKNNNSGVSMLTLVITIVIIIILALIAFAASTRTVEEANYSTYVNNVSEVGTFFEDTSVKMHGSEMLKDNTKRDEQIYNYVAKGGSGEADFLHVTALPAYTIIEENAAIGINLPKVKVESGTGKMVPIKYASTKNGKIFTWPPYEHNGELWITPNDTVESKMQTSIQVGEEFFKIEIDYKDGTLIGAGPGSGTPVRPGGKDDPEGSETPGGTTTPGGSEGGSNNQEGTGNEGGSSNNSGDVNPDGTTTPGGNTGNTGNQGGTSNPGGNTGNQGGSGGTDTPSHQHDFSSKTETSTYLASDATCVMPAKYYYKCTGCSEKGTSTYTSGKSLGHDFKDQEPSEKYLANDASCVLQPKYYFKCVRCAAKGTETYASGTPLGHDYGDFKTDKAANCKEEGQRSKTCTRCFATETEKIPIDSSNHVGGKSSKTEKEATCTSGGSKKLVCNGCNAVLGTESTKALGHSFTAKVDDANFKANDATCTEGTKYYFKCSRCSSKGTETYISGDALGHDYKDVITEATCKDKGYTTHTCERCKDVVVDTYTEAGDHSWSEWEIIQEGSCTVSEIQIRKCNLCTHTEIDEVSELGHDYKTSVTLPTCTEKGYTTFKCTRCDDEYDDLYVNATGHAWGEWLEITPVTCTDEGEDGRKCDTCGATETRTIAAQGHDFGEFEVSIEATCIQAGELIRSCSRCNLEDVEHTEVDPNNHKNVTTETKSAAKCTTTGVQTITCHDCDVVLEEQVINALGHDFTVEVQEDEFLASNETCTKGKIYYYQCSRCEEKGTETYEVGSALGHEFGEPVFNWAADHCSCKAIFTCIRNDKTEQVACGMKIDVLKEVSCEESGEHLYTATATYEGLEFVDTYLDIVPPAGHQYGDPNFNVSTEDGFIHANQQCPCGKIHSTNVNIQGEVVKKEPTCEDSGSKDVTVSVTIGGKTYTDTITVVTPPKGHEGETEFEWYDDNQKAIAIFRCSCGDEQRANATVTITKTREATCTQASEIVYTAVAIFEGEEFKNIKTIHGEPLGHSYNTPIFTWAEDNKTAKATVTCSHGDFTQTVNAAIGTSTPIPALCETEGVLRYTASVRVNGVYHYDYRDHVIPATGHTGTAKFNWSGDCTAATIVFTCNCGTVKTAYAEIVEEIIKAPTCTEKGENLYTGTGIIDGVTYTDTKTLYPDALGHTYGEPTFIWAEDNKDADATVPCLVCDYVATKYPTIKVETITQTTCDTDGVKKYIAKLTINEVEYSEEREVVIEAYNHSRTELVNKTEDYTGDLICSYCRTVLEKGHGPQVKALLLADNSLVFVKDMTTYSYGDAFEDTTVRIVYKESQLNTGEYGFNIPWESEVSTIKKVVVKDEFAPANTARWFNYFTNCTEYNLAKLDMSKVTSMEAMFRNNPKLTNLDVSGWNTSNVTNMDSVFEDCTSLKNIVGLADWNTAKVEDMYGMFENCMSLQKLTDISGWNTAKVSNMNLLFAGMSNLRELDITNWSRGQYATEMFEGCVRLEKITYGAKFTFHPNGRLPEPSSSYIPGIGYGRYWYILDEVLDGDVQSYYPSYMPTGKVVTCVAAVYNVYYSGVDNATFDPERIWLYSKYSPDFTLRNPSKEGSEFIGWTGNGITTPTTSMVVTTGSTGEKRFTANWKLRYEVPTSANATYNGTAQNLLKSSTVNYGTMYYRLGEDGEWTTSIPKATNAGTYNIYYYVSAGGGYEQTEVMGPVTGRIYKADGVINTHPAALNLTYDGSYQELVTAGHSSTGSMQYKVSGEYWWRSSVPTAKDAGEYYVYYKATATDNYSETTQRGPIKVTIKKADATFSYEPTALELRYNGEWQNLVTSGYSSYGTVYYRLGQNGAWSTSIPTAKDNGQYEIYYYIEGNNNVNSSEVMGPITATITGYPGQITPPGALNLTYTGQPQALVTPATSTTGTVYYKLGGTSTWTTEIPTAINPGTYRIYYYASESGDYIETSRSVYVTSVISSAEAEDPDLEDCRVVYNQPYVLNIGAIYIDLIFREDGSAEAWLADDEGTIIPSDFVITEGNTITIATSATESITLVVSENGSMLSASQMVEGELIELSLNLNRVEPKPVRYGKEYIGYDSYGNTLKGIVYEDGSGVMYVNDTETVLPAGAVIFNEHSISLNGEICPLYPDGSRVMVDGYILVVKESVIKFGEKYSAAMGDAKMSIVMFEDGSCDVYQNDEWVQSMPAGALTYTENTVIAPPNDIIGNSDYMEIPLSRDGSQIMVNIEDGIMVFGLVLEDVATTVRIDEWYLAIMQGEDYAYLVPHADGSVDVYNLNFEHMEYMPYGVVYGANNTLNFMEMIAHVSIDGKTITMIPTMYECKWIKNDSPILEGTSIVCNQPYRIEINNNDYEEIIFRVDGSAEIWTNMGFGLQIPAENIVINGNDITITIDEETTNATVSESGNEITLATGGTFTLTRIRQGDFRYGKTYMFVDDNEIYEGTIYKDGSVVLNYNGYISEFPMNSAVIEGHKIIIDGMEISIHPDGMKVLYNGLILETTDCVLEFEQPYSASFLGEKITIIFYKNGAYKLDLAGSVTEYPAGSFTYTYNTITIKDSDTILTGEYTVANDGSKITALDLDTEYESGFVLESDETAVIFGRPYAVISNGEIAGYMVMDESGAVEEYTTDFVLKDTMPHGIIYGKNNTINYAMLALGTVSEDGKYITVIPGQVELELTEIGLYFGKMYEGTDANGDTWQYKFYLDGSMDAYKENIYQMSLPAGTVTYGANSFNIGSTEFIVSSDGKSFAADGMTYYAAADGVYYVTYQSGIADDIMEFPNGRIKTYTKNSSDITLIAPTKEGYEFRGWVTVEGEQPNKNIVIPTGSKGDKHFIAVWKTAGTNIVKLDYNDGITKIEEIEAKTATDLPTPTREGYTFNGWYLYEAKAGTKTMDTFTNPKSDFPWTKDANGVWSSSNSLGEHHNTISSMISEEFVFGFDGGTISFDWRSNGESGYDYLAYDILNVETGAYLSGATEPSRENNLASLKNQASTSFTSVNHSLDEGRYKIIFLYAKDSSMDYAEDKGFVKNIVATGTLIEAATTPVPATITEDITVIAKWTIDLPQ